MAQSYNVQSSGNIAVTTGAKVPTAGQLGMRYHGMSVTTATTATAVVTVYHGIAATAGNEIDFITLPAAATAVSANRNLSYPVECPDGIYIVVTGTGAVANVLYSLGS
jgi:hypothetical protein